MPALRSARHALLGPLLVTAVLGLAPAAQAAAPAASASASSAVVETRDPLTWPFSRDSIWNTPIGSAARYVPAGLRPAGAWRGQITVDPEFISVDPRDPLRTLHVPGQAGHGARVRVAPDLAHDRTWNGCATLLDEKGTGVWSGQPLQLAKGGAPTWTFSTQRSLVDLRGPGVEGCHGGSGLSGIGGSLRVGELDAAGPLRHALKINLYCARYCYRGTSMQDSKRWPALVADSYWAHGYGGRLPALRMGALLAVPPSVDLSSVTHPKARKIAVALRDFGGYLVDDTAWDVHALSADQRMLDSGEWPREDRAFHAQLQHVFGALAVVDDNGPESVGGAGVPRAPLAPCFADDRSCLEQAVPDQAPPASAPPVARPAVRRVPVSSLTPERASNGWGPLETDRSNGERAAGDGGVLTISGRTYGAGLGVHAASEVVYRLDGAFDEFTAQVGVDDEVGGRGSVRFEVWVDGRLRARTPVLTGEDGASAMAVPVVGAQELRLVVDDAEDGDRHDHAVWGDAELVAAGPDLDLVLDRTDDRPSLLMPGGATAPLRVMPLGDSITDGYPAGGSCGDTRTHRPEQGSYRVELGRRYASRQLQFVGSLANGPSSMHGGRAHEGHCGRWLKDHPQRHDLYSRVASWVASAQPDVVLLQAGTNDVLHSRASAEQIATRLGAVIDRILAAKPQTEVLVASLPPMHASTAAVNRLIPSVVDARAAQGEAVHFVDHAQAGLTYPQDYQPGDFVHPDASGYAKLADSWYRVLSRLHPAN